MISKFRSLQSRIGDTFWLLPALYVITGVAGASALVAIERAGAVPQALLQSHWLYDGGGTGARTLLGAVASSTIGVAGTVFSITIAALSLAAGQMGPRLLRNFTKDRGNQSTLGIFLGTFSYSLIVLRSVRTQDEGTFVPHLALTAALALAFICVGTLIYFVGHMSTRINVDSVIDLVSRDVASAIDRLTTATAGLSHEPAPAFDDIAWRRAYVVPDARDGYLEHVDGDGLAAWAERNDCVLRLAARPGDHIFPGAPIALITRDILGASEAVAGATSIARQRSSGDDLEYPIRQLVEVAVRALSPGINDPETAISVLDHLGTAMCKIVARRLPGNTIERNGIVRVVRSTVTYGGLLDASFHSIRENASTSPPVLIKLLDVLSAICTVEKDEVRLQAIECHADLVLADARRNIGNRSDLRDIENAHGRVLSVRLHGPVGRILARF